MAKTKAEIQRDYAKRSGYKDQQKYAAAHTKQIGIVLNTTTDADILQKLSEVPNKQGYIKELVRADLSPGVRWTFTLFYCRKGSADYYTHLVRVGTFDKQELAIKAVGDIFEEAKIDMPEPHTNKSGSLIYKVSDAYDFCIEKGLHNTPVYSPRTFVMDFMEK